MTQSDRFWDKIAEKYAKDPIANLADYEATKEKIRAHLTPETRVLELGCGTGSTALELAADAGPYLATDISGAMIAIAEAKRSEADLTGLTFQRAGADEALAGGPYDMILGLNLLHLLETPEDTIHRIHAALVPGGLCITKTACLKGAAFYLRPMVGLMQLVGKAPHVTFFTAPELEAMFRAAGFEIAETLTQAGTAPRHFVVARRA